ncbi:methylglutaconyl-CoA hydratase, mitochondrial-like [Glandiceps talaboti]
MANKLFNYGLVSRNFCRLVPSAKLIPSSGYVLQSSCKRRFYSTENKLEGEDVVVSYIDASDEPSESMGVIAVLALNRPRAWNTFSRNLVAMFANTVQTIKFDRNVRTFIICSTTPGIFCAGADLKERAKMKESEVGPFVARGRALISELENLPMPVIAALDGGAYGGGMEMALGCDLRIASTTAKLGLTETKLGIIPGGGGTQRLPRIIGAGRAKEMIFTGKVVDGVEAERIGLVNYCVEQNKDGTAAYDKAIEIAKQICQNGPIGVKMAKFAISKGSEVDLRSGLAIEEACYAQVIPTKDRMIALKAFREKKRPIFTGE